MSASVQKAELRKKLLAARRNLDPAVRRTADARIAESVCRSEAFQKARCVLCYASMPEETDTTAIIAAARHSGKTVAFPRCDTSAHTMHFYAVTNGREMQKGAYGIPEPVETCPLVEPSPTDLCVVPALAADADGNRLGYGGGYYDRYLSSHTVQSICICYDIPFSDPVPVEQTDVPTDSVIRF